jgi:hypothetical protein
MPGDFVKLILQRPDSRFAVNELQMAAALVVSTRLVDDPSPHEMPGQVYESSSTGSRIRIGMKLAM